MGKSPPPNNLQTGVSLTWGPEQRFGACPPGCVWPPAGTWGASSRSPRPAKGRHPHPSEEGQPAAHRPPRGPLLAPTATRQEPWEDPGGGAGSIRGGATRPGGGFQGAPAVCRIQDGLSGPSRRFEPPVCLPPKPGSLGKMGGTPRRGELPVLRNTLGSPGREGPPWS